MQKNQRILVLLIVAALTVAQLPVMASATRAGEGGEVIAFDTSPEETVNQTVTLVTSLGDLNLPYTLNTTVRVATASDIEVPKPDIETVQDSSKLRQEEPSDPVADSGVNGEPEPDEVQPEPEPDKTEQAPTEPETMEMNVPNPVEWISSPDYDGEKAGAYTFTAQVEGFTVSATPASITAAVGEITGTVTTFDILPNSTDPNFYGRGTVDSPFLIGTAEELANLASLVNAGNDVYQNAYYWLTSNLDLSIYDASNTGFNSGNGWVPIGSNTNAFKGNFDGNSKTITGLYINDSGRDYAGLFGLVSGTMGVIHNLTVEGVSINAGGSTGGIVGRAEDDANINHCSASGTVKGSGNIGGVAGFIDQATMDQCGAAVAVSGSTCIGGVVGSLGTSASVTNCYSTETVSGSDDYVGGVVGNLGTSASVTNCYFTGTVSVSGSNVSCVGGVVGNVGNSASVTNCYATGTIKGDPYGGYAKYVGGVAGGVSGSITSCCFTGLVDADDKVGGVAGGVFSGAIVSNCYATGTVRTTESAGGIAGSVSSSGIVTSCYSTGLVQGYQYIGGIAGYAYEGSVTDCMALGPEVRSAKEGYGGRVVTGYYYVLSDNLAFSGMLNKAGNTSWPNVGGNYRDGKSITAEELQTSASFPLVFMQAPWTYEPGSLPGLGNTVEMPAHITTQLPNLQDALVELQAASYTYDGTAQEPAVQVTFEGDKLVENEDYSVSYSDNINAGNAKVTVTGIGVCRGTKTEIFVIEPKPLTADMLTDVIGTFTYTGTAHTPDVTVTDGSETLQPGTDYDVAYLSNTDAGTAIANVTGKGNYIGMAGKNFAIGKAPLTITGGTVAAKTYDGTRTANITELTFNGLQNGETLAFVTEYGFSNVQFDSADAGIDKTVTATVTLFAGTPLKARNYTLSNPSLTLTGKEIKKAAAPTGVNQTFEAVKGYAKDYDFDLTTLLPNVTGTLGAVAYTPVITQNSDGVLGALAYTSGNTLTLPVQAVASSGKTAMVTVAIKSDNYNDFTAMITVNTVGKMPVSITGITMTGGVYSGSLYAYSGTPAFTLNADDSPVNITEFDVLYTSTDGGGYSSEDAPINAGMYQLTISVPDSNIIYTGSQSYIFAIAKRPITVKADDKSMTRGGTIPTFTYTVDGQLSGETALAEIPTLTCEVDGKTAGGYPITVDLTGVSYTANYTAAIPGSVAGTLTVNNSYSGESGGSGVFRILTSSATGIRVSGNDIHSYATLTVKEIDLHAKGNCVACDEIRKAQAEGQLILGFDIDLTEGFSGPLNISIPVGNQHNGRTVTILHCVNGRLETLSATVTGGKATFTVTSLSPFAVTKGLSDSMLIGPPNTGDAANPTVSAMLCLAAFCSGYLVMKKRKA